MDEEKTRRWCTVSGKKIQTLSSTDLLLVFFNISRRLLPCGVVTGFFLNKTKSTNRCVFSVYCSPCWNDLCVVVFVLLVFSKVLRFYWTRESLICIYFCSSGTSLWSYSNKSQALFIILGLLQFLHKAKSWFEAFSHQVLPTSPSIITTLKRLQCHFALFKSTIFVQHMKNHKL